MTAIFIDTTELLNPTGEYLTSLLKRKLVERSKVRFSTSGECDWVIRLELDPTIGEEGYRITDGAPQELVIIGNDPLGLLHVQARRFHGLLGAVQFVQRRLDFQADILLGFHPRLFYYPAIGDGLLDRVNGLFLVEAEEAEVVRLDETGKAQAGRRPQA